MAGSREKAPVVAADMRGSDSSRLRGEQQLKEGAHRGNPVSPVLTSAPPLPELDFEQMSAEDILRWGYEEFGDKLCLTCSWQKQSSVLVHMVSELGLGIPVIELDTQLFFRESYETRDRLVERYGLELESPQVITVAEQHKREGPNLWETDPDRCCHIRKVEPLVGALPGLEVPPARRLGREARLGLHPGQRDSVQPVARVRVPVDRLHPVHPPDCARRGGARRPLGRFGQARVRHPHRHADQRDRVRGHVRGPGPRTRLGTRSRWAKGDEWLTDSRSGS